MSKIAIFGRFISLEGVKVIFCILGQLKQMRHLDKSLIPPSISPCCERSVVSGLTWQGEELALEPVGDVTKPSVADPGRCSGSVVSARADCSRGTAAAMVQSDIRRQWIVTHPKVERGRERGDTCRGGWRWVWQASLWLPVHRKDPVL